jgi:hypothetical protein
MNKLPLLLPMVALLLLPVSGHGANQGFYIGAGVGSASFKDDFDIDDLDEDDVGYKLFAGFRATPNIAVEGGYRDFGKAETGDGAARIEVKSTGWDAYGMLLAPIGIVDLFAKGGVIFWDTEADAGGINLDEDGNSFAWGLGGAVNFGACGRRLEYESFEVDRPNELWMLTLSGVVSFGGR